MEARHALVRNYPPDCSGDRDCHICACDVNALPYRARRRAMRRCGTGLQQGTMNDVTELLWSALKEEPLPSPLGDGLDVRCPHRTAAEGTLDTMDVCKSSTSAVDGCYHKCT
eukprot:1189697-Prorocentrum_minimum.AAC.3